MIQIGLVVAGLVHYRIEITDVYKHSVSSSCQPRGIPLTPIYQKTLFVDPPSEAIRKICLGIGGHILSQYFIPNHCSILINNLHVDVAHRYHPGIGDPGRILHQIALFIYFHICSCPAMSPFSAAYLLEYLPCR